LTHDSKENKLEEKQEEVHGQLVAYSDKSLAYDEITFLKVDGRLAEGMS